MSHFPKFKSVFVREYISSKEGRFIVKMGYIIKYKLTREMIELLNVLNVL